MEQNYVEALAWYRKAADQGCAAAQYKLGVMYEEGLEVEQNQAADQGHVLAQDQLGRMHQNGLRVEQ